ncbi:MAG: hypothetical protein CL607_09345 [Anaerolineaceae bacterium]|nr:hypothetical protein [Anaerolineaceae bacterium]
MARKREFSEKDVLDKAISIFLEKGFEATSILDLKRAMGISTSSMYDTFGDKRGVFVKALGRYCELERLRLVQLVEETPSAMEVVSYIFDSLDNVLQNSPENQGSLTFNTMVEFGTRDAHITEIIFTHFFRIADIILGVVKAGQASASITTQHDAEHLTHLMLCTLYGLAAIRRAQPTYPFSDAIKQLVYSFLEAPIDS